jgi:hypothetical protein
MERTCQAQVRNRVAKGFGSVLTFSLVVAFVGGYASRGNAQSNVDVPLANLTFANSKSSLPVVKSAIAAGRASEGKPANDLSSLPADA